MFLNYLHIAIGTQLALGFLAFALAWRARLGPRFYLFAIFSFATAIYTHANAHLYSSNNLTEYLQFARWQTFAMPMMVSAFFLFSLQYLHGKISVAAKAYVALILLQPIVRLFLPNLGLYREPLQLGSFITTWGEKLSFLQAPLTPYAIIYQALLVFSFLWLFIACIKVKDPESRKRSQAVFLATFASLGFGLYDAFIMNLGIATIYLAETGFFTAAVILAMALIEEALQSERFRTQLHESESRRQWLSSVLEQVAESVLVTDPQGHIEYANSAFTQLTGYERDEVLGRKPNLLKSGQHPTSFYKVFWENLVKGQAWNGRFINKRKDGTIFYAGTMVSPLRTATGQLTGYLATQQDITIQVRLEEKLRHSQKFEALSTLSRGILHDIRNVHSAIGGALELQKMTIEEEAPQLLPKIAETYQIIDDVLEKASSITGRLSTLARSKEGDRLVQDLVPIVEGLVRLIESSFPKSIAIRFVGPTQQDLPMRSLVDAVLLEQVLLNLCINANHAMTDMRKAGERHGGTLTVRLHVCENQNCIDIQDTGVGIAPEVIPRLFEPLFTTREKAGGTGLGLAMADQIIQAHQGSIQVRTVQAQGTTFQVSLPRHME